METMRLALPLALVGLAFSDCIVLSKQPLPVDKSGYFTV
jgi:hypothetical protein